MLGSLSLSSNRVVPVPKWEYQVSHMKIIVCKNWQVSEGKPDGEGMEGL